MPFVHLILLAAAANAPPPDAVSLLTGSFTNEEQVYFDKEAGRPAPAWFAMTIVPTTTGLSITEPDMFGKTHSEAHALTVRRDSDTTILDYGKCQRLYRPQGTGLVPAGVRGTCHAPATMTAITPQGITLTFPDGKTSLLRRARPATCWTAIPKKQPKADGSPDWHFVRDVKLHDQGGRALVGGGDSGADPLVIRMRNVVWPPSADGKPATNKPSIVLYVHKPDQPDHAESYVWADPGAARIGINLRWMQASCGIDGAEQPS
jgi:hypothetical protein